MAITAPLLWLDGALVSSSDATVPLMGHAAQRGSLVFDVGSFHATERGPALFRAREHVERLRRSAQIVGLEVRFDDDTLVDAAVRVVAECAPPTANGIIRWSVFYEVREPDLLPRDPACRVAVAVQFLEDPPRRTPIRVAVFGDAMKAPPEALSPEAKVAASYVGPMIARRRAIAAGADDVVLVDRDGNIAEAPIANAFAVVAGTLWTPPLGRILPGITRDTVLAIARADGLNVREEALPCEVFASADEAFLTATTLPLTSIGWVNGRALGRGASAGSVTSRLLDRVLSARNGKDLDRRAWLTFVR